MSQVKTLTGVMNTNPMKAAAYQPWLHRVAVLTACAALLPIVVGALVTTKDAGMAFPDWPSSDGHNMFLYPWLKSAGDQFLEHSHRLAGILIGMVSIGLVILAWRNEPRQWVRVAATLVLVAVIVQGLLGGLRVLMDERVWGMVHGSFAAWVFTLMAGVALFTSKSWFSVAEPSHLASRNSVGHLKPLAIVTPMVIYLQYVLGGLVRHLGTALHEHLGVAFLALLFIIVTVVSTHRSGVSWVRRPAWLLLLLVIVQMALGAAAWATKFGFASIGYVAVQHSLPQVAIRTLHTVLGMLVMMTSIIYTIRVFRLDALDRRSRRLQPEADRLPHSLPMEGSVL